MPRESSNARAFAESALGALLERLGETTAELERLRAGLRSSAPVGTAGEETSDLARACAELERQGWLFGMLAGELESDVLFERRERHGLRHALELVADMLAREGVRLIVPELPELEGSDRRSNAICAVIAHCVHTAHRLTAAPGWSFSRDGALSFAANSHPELARAIEDGARRISGARARCDGAAMRLELPRECLVWR